MEFKDYEIGRVVYYYLNLEHPLWYIEEVDVDNGEILFRSIKDGDTKWCSETHEDADVTNNKLIKLLFGIDTWCYY